MQPSRGLDVTEKPLLGQDASDNTFIIVALVVAQLCFGAWSVVSDVWVNRGEGASYEAFFVYRCLLGASALAAFSYRLEGNRPGMPPNVSLGELITLSVLFVMANLAFLTAVGYIGSFLPALGVTLVPVYVCAICIACRLEAVHRSKVLGMLFAVLGAVLIAVHEETRKIRSTDANGALTGSSRRLHHPLVMVVCHVSELWYLRPYALRFGLCMIAVHVVCSGNILMLKKELLRRSSPLQLSACMYSVGLVWAIIAAVYHDHALEVATWKLSAKNVYALMYSLLDVVLGSVLVAWALKRTRATTVAASLTLQPIGSAFVSWVFLGTFLHMDHVIGLFLTTTGLLLVVYSQSLGSKEVPKAKSSPIDYSAA
jgi:drug/metabolite transporter (DMT)-like permease